MAQKALNPYQSLGNGVYRVVGTVRRDAMTGRWVTGSRKPGSSAPKSSKATDTTTRK